MYLNPQIHDTQDTLTIRVGYIGIHIKIRISSPTRCGDWMCAWAPWAPCAWASWAPELPWQVQVLLPQLPCLSSASWMQVQVLALLLDRRLVHLRPGPATLCLPLLPVRPPRCRRARRRVKYMQNVKIHVFSWNVTEHLRYI